jgi:hypothetical protein
MQKEGGVLSRIPSQLELVEHIPRARYICIDIYLHRDESLYWADDPYLQIVLGCAHEQKAHIYSLQWVESIGVANKNAAFATLLDLAKRFEAYWTSFLTISMDLLYLRIPQRPRCPDLAIFVLTDRRTKPLVHARGVIILEFIEHIPLCTVGATDGFNPPLNQACTVVQESIGVSDIGVATMGQQKGTICDVRGSYPSLWSLLNPVFRQVLLSRLEA